MSVNSVSLKGDLKKGTPSFGDAKSNTRNIEHRTLETGSPPIEKFNVGKLNVGNANLGIPKFEA